eukprot:29580-Pelagococcus_subviridis.AAC.9
MEWPSSVRRRRERAVPEAGRGERGEVRLEEGEAERGGAEVHAAVTRATKGRRRAAGPRRSLCGGGGGAIDFADTANAKARENRTRVTTRRAKARTTAVRASSRPNDVRSSTRARASPR